MIVAGTGHRPPKLGGYHDWIFQGLIILAEDFLKIKEPKEVISGMALGWDQALAQAAINLGISLTCALPFDGMEERWYDEAKARFTNICMKADRIEVLSKEYHGGTYQIRNEWMVDNSDLVVALWDGSSGGTFNCVYYATKVGIPIINLWDKWSVK
jgi:uncharacterized phage-like protein YoqJ